MEEIRNMWCDILEELLQCPVCLDATQGIKHQCMNGHHICNSCKTQLLQCPLCKSPFIQTRNLAVEQLSAKLHDIKLSLIHPYHELNRHTLHNKVCVTTQTENICMPSTSSYCQTEHYQVNDKICSNKYGNPRNEQQKSLINLAPRIGKGSYPCRIGSCVVELPHGRIIGHLRYHHGNNFFEFNTKNNIFKKKWTLEHGLNREFDFAFHIKEMGLFFLNVSVNQIGDLVASVQIVNCNTVSKQFTYTFGIVGALDASYSGPVKSCRVRRESLLNECLHVRNGRMLYLVDNKKWFHCNLTIKRRIDYKTTEHEDPVNVSHALEDI